MVKRSPVRITTERPRVQGKFIFVGNEKLYVRGVSYGGFRPDDQGIEFPNREVIDRDFAQMSANGINAVRVYTTPPRSLLDIAHEHNLRVMVGLTGEQFIGYLIDKHNAPDIENVLRARVRECAGHPAVLCYVIGNEIPASIVRWMGPERVESYLERLYQIIKAEDPGCLVTYVNYPTTEYLDLPFLDFICFNVYLESQERFRAYLGRLQNIAGERPLIMSEIGLDSLRNGEDAQATMIDWQIRTTFEAGCAGVFVFSWTDEWHRGGIDVDDWAFGLTTKTRQAKPALGAVQKAYSEIPFAENESWPFVSVVVCTYNGSTWIRDCCEGLSRLDYPNYEVIVVNDGSTDGTKKIISQYDFKVIHTDNQGLSTARNLGLQEAKGEIIAYLDDDAYPDEQWLRYLAASFKGNHYSGIGGPNIAPPGDGFVSECVANAPGNPVYVLLTDQEAEHIPGCNMAFRKDHLQAIGGFDPRFRTAGDDVDVCWRIQENGWSLGLNAAATVWHHRRNSLHNYWKQQVGYGRAESQLMAKWPYKHNSLGHWLWRGQIYGQGLTQALPLRRPKVFHGKWGSAPFQSLYNPGPGTLLSLSLMPEWYLLVLLLTGFTALGLVWKPMLISLPFLVLSLVLPITQAIISAKKAQFQENPKYGFERFKFFSLTAFLHLFQPMARLWGRLTASWNQPQKTRHKKFSIPMVHISNFWNEEWKSSEQRLETVEKALYAENAAVARGGDFDRWDLEVRSGLVSSARTCMAIEDHGSGRQLIRFRSWPKINPPFLFAITLFSSLAILAAIDQAWIAVLILGIIAITILALGLWNCATTLGTLREVIENSNHG
ncbi:MAG: glycosyltransferase [Chloroflexota bacterium]|nr:MAG: glycosyltransferase [Chloroflexota bacterium]